MYRYRRRRKLDRRRRRALSAVALSAVLALVVGIPTLAAGDPVNNTLNNIGLGSGSGGSSGGGGGSVGTQATGPTYTPPLHGTNPHGQGVDAVIDLQPHSGPLSGDPSSDQPPNGEEVILGDSRGDQNPDGSYSGKVTLLWLFGNPIVQVTSEGNQSNHSPVDPLQQQLLNQICDGSGGQLCLTVLKMDSSSSNAGGGIGSSTNSFEVLGADIGGDSGLHADVLSSDGNIAGNGTCQQASGQSTVANVHAGSGDSVQPIADALESSSSSDSCSGTVTNDSTTLALGGNDVLSPNQCLLGTQAVPLIAMFCGADDTNGSQTGQFYGVREALTLFALITDETSLASLLKITGGASESHAVRSAGPTPPTPTTPSGGTAGAGGKGGKKGGAGGGGAGGAGAGAAAGAAAAGGGQLAFTGADLLALGLIGGALILGGLALTTTAGRRPGQTT